MGRPAIKIQCRCSECAEQFMRKPSKIGSHCSQACLRASQARGRVTSECGRCGDAFSHKRSSPRRFCSAACFHATRTVRTIAAAKCEACGSEFTYPVGAQAPRRYCARACYARAKWAGKTYPSPCKRCGAEFLNLGWRVQQYCSRGCHRADKAAEYVTQPCPHCGQEFTCKANWPVIHCSRKCQRAAKQAEIEYLQEHPGYWRRLQDRPYYGESWPAARRAARARDRVCGDCGSSPEQTMQQLSVHHIIPFRRFGTARHLEANALGNLVSLCQACHASREGWAASNP